MPALLLELFSEEIPARMQARAADDLLRLVADGLDKAGLAHDDGRAYATPRRLAIAIDGIPAAQPDVVDERKGPRVGSPQPAIDGFLRGAGVASLEACERRATDKGEFWFATVRRAGRPTVDVLGGVIETAVRALPWPKSMRFGQSTFRWVRPLPHAHGLFDGKALPGALALDPETVQPYAA
ncbi:MAG: glycine--tRNA ligase subunit beta, partial [Alphaproteobacteria bacterium]